MKRLWILLLCSIGWGQTHEILRPTVDTDGGASVSNILDSTNCPIAAYNSNIAQPNWYDSGGLATSSILDLTNSNQSIFRCSNRVFTTWQTTTNTYTSLNLNVNSAGTSSGNGGVGTLSYSVDGGAHWTQIRQSISGTSWSQTTDIVGLSASQDLTKLQVAANDTASPADPGGAGNGRMKITGFDIWTDGVYTPAIPPVIAPPPIVAPSPVIVSRLFFFTQVAIASEMKQFMMNRLPHL